MPAFNNIQLVSAGGMGFTFQVIGGSTADNYILRAVDGLGPPDININMANTSMAFGVYQGRVLSRRELTFLIKLNPSATLSVATMRENLYKLLSGAGGSTMVTVKLRQDSVTVMQTTGYIKHFEIAPFEKESLVQIVVSCTDSYFYDPAITNVSAGNLSGASQTFTVNGTAETWLAFDVTLGAATSTLVFLFPDSQMLYFSGYSWLSGDKISVDMRPGKRVANMTRSGTTTSILPYTYYQSTWPAVKPGSVTLNLSATSPVWNNIRYYARYWGI